jgi:hypothetical protein
VLLPLVDLGQAVMAYAGSSVLALRSALLGLALALALILAILPMAIVLFAAFMLVKLAVLGCVMAKRRHRHRKERLQ